MLYRSPTMADCTQKNAELLERTHESATRTFTLLGYISPRNSRVPRMGREKPFINKCFFILFLFLFLFFVGEENPLKRVLLPPHLHLS